MQEWPAERRRGSLQKNRPFHDQVAHPIGTIGVVVDVVLVVAVAVADEGARQRAGRVGWAVRPEVPAGTVITPATATTTATFTTTTFCDYRGIRTMLLPADTTGNAA